MLSLLDLLLPSFPSEVGRESRGLSVWNIRGREGVQEMDKALDDL